jgi:hypothetical protein
MNKFIPNPYDVLEISPEASNQEITIAFTTAMKRRKYPPNAIAIARKSLMNPQSRIIADYLRPNIPVIKRFKHSDFSALNTPISKLEFLSEFSDLATEISESDRPSLAEQRLGEVLFSDFYN